MDYLARLTMISGLLIINLVTLADELPEGEWQGSVIMYEQAEQLAKFKVRQKSSGVKITMYYNSRPYQFGNLSIDADKMTFTLDTGSAYSCELSRLDDDKFSGECVLETEEEKRTIELNMQPPEEIEQEDKPIIEPVVEEIIGEESGDTPDEKKESE